jgi:hypothetical protein
MMLEKLDDIEFGGRAGGNIAPTVVAGLLVRPDDLEGEIVDPVEALPPEARMVFEEARRLTTIRYVV